MGTYRGAQAYVQGLNQLRRTLREAGDDLSDLKELNAEAAAIAARASAKLAPVRSGRLKNTVRSSGTKTTGVIRSGTKRVPYAGPVHWGWKKRNIKPQPFLADGTQNSKGEWLPVYELGLDGIVRRVKGM